MAHDIVFVWTITLAREGIKLQLWVEQESIILDLKEFEESKSRKRAWKGLYYTFTLKPFPQGEAGKMGEDSGEKCAAQELGMCRVRGQMWGASGKGEEG